MNMQQHTDPEDLNAENQVKIIISIFGKIRGFCIINDLVNAPRDSKRLILNLKGIRILNGMQPERNEKLHHQKYTAENQKHQQPFPMTRTINPGKCQEDESHKQKNQRNQKDTDLNRRPGLRKALHDSLYRHIRKSLSEPRDE